MSLFQSIIEWLGLSSSSSSSLDNNNKDKMISIKHETCKLCENEFDDDDNNKDNNDDNNNNKIYAYMHSGHGLNRRELGRVSWAYLHTLANYYPENPSISHQKEIVELIWLYMKYYPCGYCSDMTIQEMYRNPPKVKNRKEFSEWMCQIHNEVNQRLGYPLFDCNKTSQRWRI